MYRCERESGTSKRGPVVGRVHAASVEFYGWAEIAVALETDQLSTMSHALPCTLSDEDELACNAVCHRGWDTLRNRPSGALLSEHVTTPISDSHINTYNIWPFYCLLSKHCLKLFELIKCIYCIHLILILYISCIYWYISYLYIFTLHFLQIHFGIPYFFILKHLRDTSHPRFQIASTIVKNNL